MKLFDLFVRCHLEKDGSTPTFDSYIQSPNFTGKKKEVMPVLPSILFMGRTKPPKYAFCHFFVLTTAKGDRNYGCCILFGEKKRSSKINSIKNESETISNSSKKDRKNEDLELKQETDISKSLNKKEQQSESDSDDDHTYLYAIAITSLLPLYQTLKNVLTCLLDVYPNDTEIAPFIINQVPMPPPGVIVVQFTFCDTTFLVPRPPPNQLPLIDLPFWIPFSLFGPKDLIMIFTAILTEQRVVFSSRFPAAIAPFIESILTLIYPLSCYSTYIPNLASSMAPLLCSPLPYLIGVDPSVIPLDDLEDDVLRVDLDTSSLFVAPNALPPEIPTKPRQKLLKALRKMTKLFEESSSTQNDDDSYSSEDEDDESSDDDDNDTKKKKKRKSTSSRKGSLVSINDEDNDDNDKTVKDNELIERKRKWLLQCSSLVKQPVETLDSSDFNFTIPPSAITLPLMNGLFPEMINPNKKDLFATFVKVRDAFLRFIIVLLMNTKQVSGKEVDNKINQFDSDFYKLFIGTQCFDVFIHQLDEFKNRGCKVTTVDEAKLLFFLESVQAKKNRSKLNKSKPTPFLTSSHWQHTSMFVTPFIPSKEDDFLNENDDQNQLKPCNICELVKSTQTLTFSRQFTIPLKVVKSVVVSSPLSYNVAFPTEKEKKLKKILKLGSVKKAILIQKTIRGFMSKKKYDEMKKAAIIIHSFARMANAKTFYNKKMKPAAVKIHSTVRMYLAKTKYKKMKKAAIMFQSAYRMYRQKMEYRKMKKAAIKIQSTFRMYKQRKEFLEMKKAAIKIQSTFRMFMLKVKFKKMKESAIKIQSLFRGVLARKVFKNLLIEKKRKEKEEKKKEKKRKEKEEKEKREKEERRKRERKERKEREKRENEERERQEIERREQEERERRENEERERRENEERERRENEERERREQEENERRENEENERPDNLSNERQIEIQNLLSENKPISLTDQAEYFAQLAGIPVREEIENNKSKKKKKDKKLPIKKNSKEMKKDEKKIYKLVSKVQKKKTTKKRFNGIFEQFQIPIDVKKRKDKLNKKLFDILLLNPSDYSFEETTLASKLILIGEDKMSIKEIKNYLS